MDTTTITMPTWAWVLFCLACWAYAISQITEVVLRRYIYKRKVQEAFKRGVAKGQRSYALAGFRGFRSDTGDIYVPGASSSSAKTEEA